MSQVDESDLRRLARDLSAVLRELHSLAEERDGESLTDRVGGHLGTDPGSLPALAHPFPSYQLVDVQVAFDAWTDAAPNRSCTVVGVSADQRRFNSFSEILHSAAWVRTGPVEYEDLADSPNSTRSCVRFGVFLLSDGADRSAALLRGADPHNPMDSAMVEVVATDPEVGRRVMTELRRLAIECSVLRKQVLALGPGEGNQYGALRFMKRPELDRENLVLPEETLKAIERHVIDIAAHGERLQAAGQHLKRGVLLYGPPGTGKTHTVRYLLAKLTGVTAFILSGQALQLIGQACALARVLQPSMVILEDVDLIAGDRSFGPIGTNPLLFEVLNQIDGLGDDADVTFLLTTNRVDILERALSERPGRVDAAVEIAPPDLDGRRRLFRLYGKPLGVAALSDSDLEPAVAATESRTATYLREVVRRAAINVAEKRASGPLAVTGADLATAANELLDDRAALTRAVLGGGTEPDAEPAFGASPAGPPFAGQRGMYVSRPGVGYFRYGPGRGPEPTVFAPEE